MIPLRYSHVVFYAGVVTLTVTLAVALGFWFIRGQVLAGIDSMLNAESKEIIPRVARFKGPIDTRKLAAVLKEDTENDEALFYFQVQEASGNVIYQSRNLASVGLTGLPRGLDKRTVELPSFGRLRVAGYRTPAADIQIAMSLRNFQGINDTFVRVFLVGVPLIGLLSVGLGMALRHRTLRPVRLMQEAARRISASNLDERIAIPPGSGEMAELAGLLNAMIDRLEKSFSHAKRFTAEVSHELMTPLSIIRLHTERLLNDPELPAKYHHSVEEQLQETLHLAETVERLLMLAKADASALPLNLQSISTSEFMQQFIEDALLLAESRGLNVSLAQNDDGTAEFDQGCVRQTLFNLLSNALRFSPPGSTTTFYSKCSDGEWSVEVWDEGQGVPPDRLNEIFERFVQIIPRVGPGSGAGLGLAICKSIVEMHGGRIAAHNRTDRSGLVVVFSMPLAELNE